MSSSGNPLEPEVIVSWLLSANTNEDDRSELSRAWNEGRGGMEGGHLVEEATLPRSSSHE